LALTVIGCDRSKPASISSFQNSVIQPQNTLTNMPIVWNKQDSIYIRPFFRNYHRSILSLHPPQDNASNRKEIGPEPRNPLKILQSTLQRPPTDTPHRLLHHTTTTTITTNRLTKHSLPKIPRQKQTLETPSPTIPRRSAIHIRHHHPRKDLQPIYPVPAQAFHATIGVSLACFSLKCREWCLDPDNC
jgi:hypothetical protein